MLNIAPIDISLLSTAQSFLLLESVGLRGVGSFLKYVHVLSLKVKYPEWPTLSILILYNSVICNVCS